MCLFSLSYGGSGCSCSVSMYTMSCASVRPAELVSNSNQVQETVENGQRCSTTWLVVCKTRGRGGSAWLDGFEEHVGTFVVSVGVFAEGQTVAASKNWSPA